MIPASAPPPRPAVLGTGTWLFCGLTLLVCLLAITPRTFWIDECYSARFAQQPTLQDAWNLLQEIKGSDPQMPFYIVWIWACEKFAGDSEVALRAVNLLWFLPALAALALAFAGRRRLQTAIFLIALFSPFAVYYLNEARSYTMQFSCSLMLFASVAHWVLNEDAVTSAAGRGWALGFALAWFCLCGSSLLAMVFSVAPVLLLPALLPRHRLFQLVRQFAPLWLATLAALFFLGLYYLWTLHSGDRGTNVADTGWKNLVFIGYELAGFAGLGPGRLEIRDGGAEVFVPYAAALVAYAVLVAMLVALALLDLRQKFGTGRVVAMVLAVGLPAGLVLAASAAAHFRVLGRHFSSLLPVAVLLLGLGVASAWRRGAAGKFLVLLFFSFYLASTLSLRFAARHEKDNYRAAAATAKAALTAGESVWWNADPNAAIYYLVPLVKAGPPESGRARWVIHPGVDWLAAAPLPDLVITSRRDVYDVTGALADFLGREHYRPVTNFTAFTVWQRGGG